LTISHFHPGASEPLPPDAVRVFDISFDFRDIDFSHNQKYDCPAFALRSRTLQPTRWDLPVGSAKSSSIFGDLYWWYHFQFWHRQVGKYPTRRPNNFGRSFSPLEVSLFS